MKKIISACIAAIFSLSLLNAQEQDTLAVSASEETEEKVSPPKQFTLGVTAGFSMTTLASDFDSEMGAGFKVGVNCDIPVSEYISIMPELIFAYKTAGINKLDALSLGLPEINEDKIVVDTKDKLFYMDIPVYVKGSLYYGIGRPFVAIGPMLSVGLYGEKEIVDSQILLFQGDPNPMFPFSAQEKPLYNNVDFSVNFKVGYDFDCGLSADFGFQLGMVNLLKFSDEEEALMKAFGLEAPSLKNRTFSLSLGYNFK